ncbi:MAG: hypothetical protein JNM93_14110, partial [Bacteriovoracaceae bacterium]|nr:hypothetical protein [Bacteriovoracaceae bacterium]
MLGRLHTSLLILVTIVGCSGGFAPNNGGSTSTPSFNLTSLSGNPANTVSPNFEVSGSVVVGDDITIYVDATCTNAYASGSFTGDPTVYGGGFLPDGSYPIYVIFTLNSIGGTVTPCVSAGLNFVVDTAAPSAPSGWSLSSPVNASTSNDITPVISGSGLSAENGSQARVYINDASCSAPNLVGSDIISGGNFSVNTITLANDGSDDGALNFYGLIEDVAGNTSSCTNLSLAYTLDTTGPIGHSLAINAGAPVTITAAVTLNLVAPGAVDMYVTENATCASGGSWETFNATKAFTLTNLNTTANVYFKVRDAAGNASTCVGDSILHDNLSPAIISTSQPSNAAYSTGNNLDFTV